MKHALLAAVVFASTLPAAAQQVAPPADAPPTETMERGLRLFMDGVRDEMEPALRGLQGLAQEAAPVLRRFQENLGDVVDDLDAYAAPEIQPNGDILIRRKEPLPTDGPMPNDDGSVDL